MYCQSPMADKAEFGDVGHTRRALVHKSFDPWLVGGAGLVLMRQRPSTAKGITFVTIEDETGSMNLVLFPKVWQRFFSIARTSNAWLVEGKLENRKGIIHVIVGRVEALNDSVSAAVPNKSRAFH